MKPDPDGMNESRIDWAVVALKAFQEDTRTDDEDALADLLCDLMHMCDKYPEYGKFSDELDRARKNYESGTCMGGGW